VNSLDTFSLLTRDMVRRPGGLPNSHINSKLNVDGGSRLRSRTRSAGKKENGGPREFTRQALPQFPDIVSRGMMIFLE